MIPFKKSILDPTCHGTVQMTPIQKFHTEMPNRGKDDRIFWKMVKLLGPQNHKIVESLVSIFFQKKPFLKVFVAPIMREPILNLILTLYMKFEHTRHVYLKL